MFFKIDELMIEIFNFAVMKDIRFMLTGLICIALMGIMACSDSNENDTDSSKTDKDDRISNIIRNPVTADGSQDTVNVAKITFDESVHHFGSVKEGEVVRVSYKFTNTGRVPLLIADARATCGCTVPEWPKNTIEPGESDVILVEFDTQGKKYDQNRPISIIANTLPRQTDIFITGHVEPSNN